MLKLKIMKNIFLSILISTLMLSCSSNDANEAATDVAKETTSVQGDYGDAFKINLEKSVILWWGSKPTGVHNGTIGFKDGYMNIEGGNIASAKMSIDMSTIKVLDMNTEKNAKLEDHLKTGDFFQIDIFPLASFELTAIEGADSALNVSGNLIIKDSTKNISFSAVAMTTDSSFHLVSDSFTIDRTKWGVTYKSNSIFDNLGEKFIDDQVGIKLEVYGSK